MGELSNDAVGVPNLRILAMNQSMERAAASPTYRALLLELSEDFASIDSQSLPPEY